MSRLEKLKKTESLSELAVLLGYKPKSVSYILYRIPDDKKYIEFEIPKKNGNTRKIKAPVDQLKLLQRRLADLLNDCFVQISNLNNKKSLSHGFRKDHSIVTNAKNHKNKRYVFNVDLQDFFPSINFGRVRGFFIKNHHFNINPKVATVIAQIACHHNELPQGSPCSPIISNLIGHLLDVRMLTLAKKTKCTYSRYADDLTFSTNKKDFPEKIAIKKSGNIWIAGETLVKEIEKVGFNLNTGKTSMQFKNARQITTGLIVNEKVNIKREYYKKSRSMCYELFKSGEFCINKETALPGTTQGDNKGNGTLNQLEGILSFIYQVKSPHYIYDIKGKRVKPTAITELYRNFLFYKHFFSIEKPLVVCEGPSDIVYLKCALKQLKSKYKELIQEMDDGSVDFKIGFLNFSKNLRDVLDISTGSSGLLFLINMYEKNMGKFKGEGRQYPVIILTDNDDGSSRIKSRIKEQLKIKNEVIANEKYRIFNNLYIMFCPAKRTGAIEDLFDKETLATEINGKNFNPTKGMDTKKEYSKIIFSEKVIKAKQNQIKFDGFREVLDRFKAIIEDYRNLNV